MAKTIICPKCEYVGVAAKKKRGNTKMELAGWFLLFPLGIPYTLWRIFTKFPVCRGCGNGMLIDAESPVGQRLLDKIEGPRIKPAPIEEQIEKLVQSAELKPWRPELDRQQF